MQPLSQMQQEDARQQQSGVRSGSKHAATVGGETRAARLRPHGNRRMVPISHGLAVVAILSVGSACAQASAGEADIQPVPVTKPQLRSQRICPEIELTADCIYARIKEHENDFHIPSPSATVNVGTFTPSTRGFEHLHRERIARRVETGEGATETYYTYGPDEVTVDAVNVTLTFHSNVAGVSVTANGVIRTSNGRSVSVDVGSAATVDWSITSSNRTYKSQLAIKRPPQIGVGAFTVPAFPLAIIYEPPPDSLNRNFATYATSHGVATSISIGFSNGINTLSGPPFLNFNNAASLLNSIGTEVKNIGTAMGSSSPPWVSVATGAIDLIGSLFGSTTKTSASELTLDVANTLSMSEVITGQIKTAAASGTNTGGPGKGDVFYIIRNARLMWIAWQGTVKLVLLGYDSLATLSISKIQDGQAGLDQTTSNSLLALDPWIAKGPSFAPPSARFEHKDTIEVGAPAPHEYNLEDTVTNTVSTTKTTTTTQIVDEKQGWLSYVGIGPAQNNTTATVVQNSQNQTLQTSDKLSATVTLYANESEPIYVVAVYLDKVFRTFAFRKIPVGNTIKISGRVIKSIDRNPFSNVEVTVRSGARRYVTTTDANGNFRFLSPDIPKGQIEITAAGATLRQRFTGQRIQNLLLRGATDGSP